MAQNFNLTVAVDKVKIEGVNESPEVEQSNVSVQIICNDGSNFTLMMGNNSSVDFGRQFSLNFNRFPDDFDKYFPTRLIVLVDGVQAGEADLTQLEQFKEEVVQDEMGQDQKSICADCQLVEKNLVGVVRLFVAVERRDAGAMPCKFEPPPGLISESDESFPLVDDDGDACLVVHDRVIKLQDICGPCGLSNCPIARYIKQELKRNEVKASVSTIWSMGMSLIAFVIVLVSSCCIN